MDYKIFLNWMSSFLYQLANFGEWLTSPIFEGIPSLSGFTPLTIFSLAGLTAFISVAVVKWVTS